MTSKCQCVWSTAHEGEMHYGRFLVNDVPVGNEHYRCDGHIYEFLIRNQERSRFEHLEAPPDDEEFPDNEFTKEGTDAEG